MGIRPTAHKGYSQSSASLPFDDIFRHGRELGEEAVLGCKRHVFLAHGLLQVLHQRIQVAPGHAHAGMCRRHVAPGVIASGIQDEAELFEQRTLQPHHVVSDENLGDARVCARHFDGANSDAADTVLPAELAGLVELAAIDLDATVMRQARLPDGIAEAPRGEVFERSEGERFLYRVSELPSLEEGLNPQLVLKHSLTKSLAEYSGIRWLLAALAFAGLPLVVALSWRVAKTITLPLRKLDEATRLVSAGERVDVPVETDDEIGRLAGSFNTMIEAIDEREKKIVHVGLHDGLTNLPNRKLFTEQLTLALTRRRDDRQVMVAYADLDDFKVVNDTLGHPAGDVLLREVAGFLREDLPEATIARLGGDEFAILIDDIAPLADLNTLARRIQSCFMRLIDIDGQKASALLLPPRMATTASL